MEKRIHVGAWNAVNEYQTTENDFKEIAKSGMDFIIMSYTRDEKAVENLAWAEKYNVKCLMFDGAINDAEDLTAEKVLELTKPYADSPSFAGFSICDEPDMGRYPHLAQVAKACYEAYPDKEVHVNLLPMYAACFVFGETDFDEYLESFAAQVEKMPISTDTYPFLIDENGVKSTYPDYLAALDKHAFYCRKYNRDFWLYIQSMPFLPNRCPDLPDFRFQAYTGLCFGMKGMLHFCYHITANTPPEVDYPYAAIRSNGTKSELWEYERTVNNELLAISEEYIKYRNIGAYTFKGETVPDYLYFDNIYNDDKVITDIESNESLLIGVFDEIEGNNRAYVITNMTELQNPKWAEVSLEIPDAASVTAYIKGIKTKLEPVMGKQYQFTLTEGEGVFIVVEKQ